MARPATDLCVIGAGSGGLVIAAGAVQLGARVTLIEGGLMGGDCLNHGCVPSKALLAAARQASTLRRGGMGIAAATPQVDFVAVMAHVHGAIATIAPHDSQERFEKLGVRVIRAWARFTDHNRVEAGGEVITARRFVVATGAHAIKPDLPGLDQITWHTNETVFTLTELPRALVILGGGPVAVEMAQAFARLGSAVTLVARSRVLGQDDPDAARIVAQSLRVDGVTLVEGKTATAVTPTAGGLVLTLSDGSAVNGSHLLVATGRKAALDRLDLAAAGVAVTETGVRVDASLRTTNRRVFAIGDAAGGAQFTHLAAHHAGVVLRQAVLGLPARGTALIPRVTYTDPELAQIGLTEPQAHAAHGAALTVQRVDFDAMDRAITESQTAGFVKLMIVGGKPVGVTLVGAHAGEQIGLWVLALQARVRLSAVAGMVAPYPTFGEISKRAAGAYFSPRLFDSPAIKAVVRILQRVLP
jgi:pyruvate/2-oxoglutarate dehydrogenase complex dihydrolipoamide dehydrogenase (E3) component